MRVLMFIIVGILLHHLSNGQIVWRKNANGIKIGGLANSQQIDNVPTVVPLSKGDTLLDYRTGSSAGKFGFSLSYFHNALLSRHISFHFNGGFRKRGFWSSERYDPNYGYAIPSESLNNRLDYLFTDFGFRLHTATDRPTIWFVGYGNRFDILVHQYVPFWNSLKPYKRIEFSILGQGGLGFYYSKDKKRCFIEFEVNPGIVNALKNQQRYLQRFDLRKPPGYYPSYPATLLQKYAYNYSIGLAVSFEL